QVTGLFPHSIKLQPSIRRRIICAVWSCVMLIIFFLIAALHSWTYYVIHMRQLQQLEFFNLISFIMQLAALFQAPFQIFITFWKGSKIPLLLRDLEKVTFGQRTKI